MNYGMDYQGGGGGGGSSSGGRSSYGGGGGGFAAGGASQGSGGRGGGGNRKSYDEQTIQPCTVAMILKATPENGGGGGDETGTLELPDGRKLHHVTIIGAVRDYIDNSTNTEFQIEDGTGLIAVKQWVDHNDCLAKIELRQACMRENTYVKVIGSPKYYDGKVQLIADSIKPITTGNQLTCHFLDVVFVGEKYASQSLNSNNVSSFGMQQQMHTGVGFGAGGMALQRSTNNQQGGGVRNAVLQYIKIKGDDQDMGVNINQCVQIISKEYPEPAVRKVIEELASEGHIYSTYNEDHYKCS